LGPSELQWAQRLSSNEAYDDGSVWLRFDGDGARLKLRTEIFTQACFERIARLVIEHRLSRLVIERDGEPVEIVRNGNDILARLDFLRGCSPGEKPRDSFIRARLDLARLRHVKRHRLASAFASWRQSRGRLSRDLEPLDRFGALQGGHLLVSRKGSDQAVIRQWPENVVRYTDCDTTALVGRDLADQPDKTFGPWSAKPYHEVVGRPAAWLDLIEAVVRPPKAPPMIVRYERLLLPWRASSGEVWLSGTQLVRSRTVLRSAR
jgi:hypothetical protein